MNLTLEACSLGALCIPAHFTIVGADYPALTVELCAEAMGPQVRFEPPVVDFKKIPVLEPHTRIVRCAVGCLHPFVR